MWYNREIRKIRFREPWYRSDVRKWPLDTAEGALERYFSKGAFLVCKTRETKG